MSDRTTVDPGAIRFYDNVVPSLGPGDYLVNVTQRVNPQGTAIDECWAAAQPFSVQGPRYALPPGDVHSVFPPAGAQGRFERFLPHVVFARRDLPWERNVFADPDPAARTPWLALLLFAEGEEIGGRPALLPPAVEGWTPNPTVSAVITALELYAPHPRGDGILRPALRREWYEDDAFLGSTGCTVVDVAPAAFAALLPGPGELRYLAHARLVEMTARDQQALAAADDGWYAAVVAPRLPAPAPDGRARRHVCHLVSLEGLEPYAAGAPLPEGTTRVRMISLQSWTFTCQADAGESFAEAMNGLLAGAGGAPKPTAFAAPFDARQVLTPEQRFAARALEGGYVPLRWRTRLGEQSFAWYRGPFTPVPVLPWVGAPGGDDGGAAFGTASAAMVYDPAHGVFDLSYAVAWETGRLLSLADAAFGEALDGFQRAGHRLTDLLLEHGRQAAPDQAPPATAHEVLARARPYARTGGFASHLLTRFRVGAGAPERGAGAGLPRRGAGPGRPAHPTPAALQALVAAPPVRDAVVDAAGDGAETLAAWLSRRYLLVGVPFEALVPLPELLPPESIRFFRVDPNWLEALVQGALSVGVGSSRDAWYRRLTADAVRAAALRGVPRVRATLAGSPAETDGGAPALPVAGMLVRSGVVAGWPGLEVRGHASFATDAGGGVVPDPGGELPLLRLERLSGDVLLALWGALPAVVTLAEPPEGLAFGFEDPPAGVTGGDWLYPRSTDPASYGMPLRAGGDDGPRGVDAGAAGIIDPGTRVVNVAAALAAIRGALPGRPALAPRDFAVQMVKVPEQAVFAAPPSLPPSPLLP